MSEALASRHERHDKGKEYHLHMQVLRATDQPLVGRVEENQMVQLNEKQSNHDSRSWTDHNRFSS